MPASHRGILALAVATLLAGLIGVAVHHRPARGASAATPTTAASTSVPPSTVSPTTGPPSTVSPTSAPPTTVAPQPGPGSGTLAANLLTSTDLGGFYADRPDAANAFLASAPCLAGLSPSSTQSGRAVTGLLGPDRGSVPDITEVVLSYPGSTAAAVYRSLVATLQACPSFAMSLGGTQVRVPMAPGHLPAVGDASSEYEGQFRLAGRTQRLGVALALAGSKVVAIAYIDTVPPSDAIFGDLPSTMSAALGKEA